MKRSGTWPERSAPSSRLREGTHVNSAKKVSTKEHRDQTKNSNESRAVPSPPLPLLCEASYLRRTEEEARQQGRAAGGL